MSRAKHKNVKNKDKAMVLWFDEVGIEDVPIVGGKNASLGEMIKALTPQGNERLFVILFLLSFLSFSCSSPPYSSRYLLLVLLLSCLTFFFKVSRFLPASQLQPTL